MDPVRKIQGQRPVGDFDIVETEVQRLELSGPGEDIEFLDHLLSLEGDVEHPASLLLHFPFDELEDHPVFPIRNSQPVPVNAVAVIAVDLLGRPAGDRAALDGNINAVQRTPRVFGGEGGLDPWFLVPSRPGER